jgi:osmotically-inducible protein OsmY
MKPLDTRLHRHAALAALAFAMATLVILPGCIPVAAVGIGAGTLLYADRRPTESYVADEAIETRVSSRIAEKYPQAHVNVTSYNLRVLLTGEAAQESDRAQIARIALGAPNVKAVINEIQIAAPSTFASRGNDSYITSKVKARLVDTDRIHANHIKVVTEAGVVFLMGIVSQREADIAVEIARTTGGAQRVVRAFEIVAESELAPDRSQRPAKPAADPGSKVPPGGANPVTG